MAFSGYAHMVILSAKDLTYEYSAEVVGINSEFKLRCSGFTVREKENVYIVGPNGSGKSTFVSLLNGDRRPTSGKINVGQGQSVAPRIVTLHAHDHELLIGNLSVREHIVGAIELGGDSKRQSSWFYASDCNHIVDAFAEKYIVDFLANTASKQIRFLSSGQKQLLILLLLTIGRPFDVIIADEPASHLDDRYTRAFFGAMASMGAATVVITHNLDAACQNADHIYVVDNGNVLALGDAIAKSNSLSESASQIVGYLDQNLKSMQR
jgi:ABC-type multidrug transport system ATPase subunit